MKNKTQLAQNLLWKYSGIVKEIIAQKRHYETEQHFYKAWCKYAAIVNKLQGILLNSMG